MQQWTKKWTDCLTPISKLLIAAVGILTLLTRQVASNASPIQSISGTLYAENFTYYKLSGEGRLRLDLYSMEGDVDLYVSGWTLTPSFTEYELKSDTCGMDTVDIHSGMKRPVGIGIYAHPSYMVSQFRMDISVVEEVVESDEYERLFRALHYYDEVEAGVRDENGASSRKSKILSDSDEEEKESMWWTILITILKFVFEIIV